MERPRVYLALPVPDGPLARIGAECELVSATTGRPSGEELRSALAGVDGVLTSNRLGFDAGLLDAAPRLRVISNFGVGYDNVDVPAATARGIAVCNTAGVLTDAVADLTMGLIIALARRLLESERLVREGAWLRGTAQLGSDLRDKTLGIIGMGRIGRAVARRASAFGMRVLFHDLFREPPQDAPSARYRELDALLREADFVSLHVNLTDETVKLVGARDLALMKPSAYLINTSRGQAVDQAALVEALGAGRIAGAALDVLEREPPPPGDPLLALPNVIVLPHIGSATRETRAAMLELAIDNLLAVLRDETPTSIVNPEALAAWERRGR